MTSNPAGDQARPPVLVARLGREQRVFPVGMRIRVGSDPALELVSINPLVSRDTHGLITSDEMGAIYTDRSRRGTFLDGKRLNGPLRITESVILRLGDPATGEELGITPPLSGAELEINRERRARRGRIRPAAIVASAVVVAGGIAAVALAVIGSPAPGGKTPVTAAGSVPQLTATSGGGCFAIQVTAEQLGLAGLPSDTYQIQLHGGPTLAPIGTATAVSIGDRGTAGSQ